jgi:hypothetical protein
MDQVSYQSRVMCEMGMQMIDLFPGIPFLLSQQVNQVNSLQKTFPAIARRISLIDPFIRGDI